MPENVFMDQLHLNKACWELWLSDDQPHSDHNGQWQRALCMVAVLQSSQPNPQRNKKNWKMYAIKQIRICAEYRDMLLRPRLGLSGTPGLWPTCLSPGSWQTSLSLGSMSRYSAQILICIPKHFTQCHWSNPTEFIESWNRNAFCITGPLLEESSSHWWFPSQRASDDQWIPLTKGQWCGTLMVLWC